EREWQRDQRENNLDDAFMFIDEIVHGRFDAIGETLSTGKRYKGATPQNMTNPTKRGERRKKGANPVRPFEVAVSNPVVAFFYGGVDGTRTRNPRRDRQNWILFLLFNQCIAGRP